MIRSTSKGFTLIELIIVIVLLGILAATALPRFVDFSGDAKKAKMEAFSAAFKSGINLAKNKIIAEGKYGSEAKTYDTGLAGLDTVRFNASAYLCVSDELGDTGINNGTQLWTVLTGESALPAGLTATVTGTAGANCTGATAVTYKLDNKSTCQFVYTVSTGAVANTLGSC